MCHLFSEQNPTDTLPLPIFFSYTLCEEAKIKVTNSVPQATSGSQMSLLEPSPLWPSYAFIFGRIVVITKQIKVIHIKTKLPASLEKWEFLATLDLWFCITDLEVSVSCPLNTEHGAEHNFLFAAVSTTPYSLFDNEITRHLLFIVVLVFLRVKRETNFFLLLCLVKIGKIKAKQWGWGHEQISLWNKDDSYFLLLNPLPASLILVTF